MQLKAVVVWWLVHNQEHPALERQDRKISSLQPLVQALFPGADYYSITGFHAIMDKRVRPALMKQFPEILHVPANHLRPGVMLDIKEVMPSNGYEWERDLDWVRRFEAYVNSRNA